VERLIKLEETLFIGQLAAKVEQEIVALLPKDTNAM
jgi:hypothetical protein